MPDHAGIIVDGRGFILPKGGGWFRGVDVSHHQKPGSHSFVGRDFVIARASYGDKPDETFAAHIKRARADGALTGAYHFFRQTKPRESQLDAFLGAVSGVTLDIVPALDLEWNTAYDGRVDAAKYNTDGRWMAEQIAERFGGCLLYTAPYFWRDMMGSPEWCVGPQFHWWLAHYGVPEGQPKLPSNAPVGMRQWAIHQYQGAPIDSNVANYLPALRIADTEPAPPPEAA